MATQQLGTLSVDLDANTARFSKALSTASQKLKTIGRGLATAAKVATAAFAAMGAASIGLIKLAGEQRAAELKLAAAIKGTGQAIDIKVIKDYAAALQEVTTFGDEVTIEAAALLTTFNLTQDAVVALLPAVQNLATTMGTDLKSQAIAVGKAIANGASALTRYGVTLTDAQKKTFEAANSTERAALLVDILGRNTGDSARAMATTGAGGLKQFSNAVGDLGEEIGFLLELSIAPWIDSLTSAVGRMIAGLKEAHAMWRFMKRAFSLSLRGEMRDAAASAGIPTRPPGRDEKRQAELDAAAKLQAEALKNIQEQAAAQRKADEERADRAAERHRRAMDRIKSQLDASLGSSAREGDGPVGGLQLAPIDPESLRQAAAFNELMGQTNEIIARTRKEYEAEGQRLLASADRQVEARQAMGTLVSRTGKASSTLRALTQSGGDYKKALVAMAMETLMGSDAFKRMVKASDSVFSALSEFVDAFAPVIDLVSRSFTTMGSWISKFSGKVKEGVGTVASWVGLGSKQDAAADATERFRLALNRATKDFDGAMEQMVMLLGDAPNQIRVTNSAVQFDRSLIEDLNDRQLKELGRAIEKEVEELENRIVLAQALGKPFATMEGRLDRLNDALTDIAETTTDATETIADAADSLVDSLTGVPEGFKVALERFRAIDPADTSLMDINDTMPAQGVGLPAAAGGNIIADTIIVQQANDVGTIEELIAAVKDATDFGSTAAGGAGSGAGGGSANTGDIVAAVIANNDVRAHLGVP